MTGADDFPTYDAVQRALVRDFLLSHVGDGYEWLGSGPDEWDCSGIFEEAWRSVGLQFPYHRVADQIRFVRGAFSPATQQDYTRHGHARPYSPELRKQLQLGDAVYVYGDVDEPDSVTHCGGYVGWGWWYGARRRMMVAAVSPQYGVKKTPIDWGGVPSGFGFIGH